MAFRPKILLSLIALTNLAAFGANDRYRISSLPLPSGAVSGEPLNINDANESVGYAMMRDGLARPVIWDTKTATLVTLDANAFGYFSAISNTGSYVGVMTSPPFGTRAILGSGGGFNILSSPDVESEASALNDTGVVIGKASFGDGSHLISWQNGIAEDLDSLGGLYSNPTDINNSGQVVGYLSDGNYSHAFLWQGAALIRLPEVGARNSGAAAINDMGDVVGWTETPDGQTRAALWKDGVLHDLAMLPESSTSNAVSINEAGQIVGYAGDAVLWQDGVAVDLNSLIPKESGWDLISASSINADGYIVGWGMLDGRQQPYLLSPDSSGVVPEPKLLGPFAGLTTLALRRRQRKDRLNRFGSLKHSLPLVP